jgi:uncharacterized protein
MTRQALNHPASPAKARQLALFESSIRDLMLSPVVHSMDQYIHHGQVTCLEHCLSVSWHSYLVCRRLGLDYRAAARGGLLHDLYLYDWHFADSHTGLHGFNHPATALRNARRYFSLNLREQDIIAKHMWPMTIIPPRHRESLVVCLVDKYCALIEVFSQRRKNRLHDFKLDLINRPAGVPEPA